MTEAEWLACAEPTPMLEYLQDRASPRKLRLLVAASARRIWRLIPEPCKAYIGAVEHCADGRFLADSPELREAFRRADEASLEEFRGSPTTLTYAIASTGLSELPTIPSAVSCLDTAATACACAAAENAHDSVYDATLDAARADERVEQARLVSDIFGNPFCSVAFDPSWRSEAVVALARGVYDDRAFDRLPVLADALVDAGCGDADLLGHCRGAGPHVRGCWAVDLVLGKA